MDDSLSLSAARKGNSGALTSAPSQLPASVSPPAETDRGWVSPLSAHLGGGRQAEAGG